MANTILIGAPIDDGQRNLGCVMGPAAYRVAGLARAIAELGHSVRDWGDLALGALPEAHCDNPAVHHLPQVLAWTELLREEVVFVVVVGEAGVPTVRAQVRGHPRGVADERAVRADALVDVALVRTAVGAAARTARHTAVRVALVQGVLRARRGKLQRAHRGVGRAAEIAVS